MGGYSTEREPNPETWRQRLCFEFNKFRSSISSKWQVGKIRGNYFSLSEPLISLNPGYLLSTPHITISDAYTYPYSTPKLPVLQKSCPYSVLGGGLFKRTLLNPSIPPRTSQIQALARTSDHALINDNILIEHLQRANDGCSSDGSQAVPYPTNSSFRLSRETITQCLFPALAGFSKHR